MKDIRIYTSIALVFSLLIISMVWWVPQKWQACQRLYDNRPAQIICFSSRR